jgi:hypothetical protein
MKRPARLAALIDVLLFVVEIRVVDTRCTSDEDIDITGDESFGAISRVSISTVRRLSLQTSEHCATYA